MEANIKGRAVTFFENYTYIYIRGDGGEICFHFYSIKAIDSLRLFVMNWVGDVGVASQRSMTSISQRRTCAVGRNKGRVVANH